MKLEIKHLAPYLPYGLKAQWNKSEPLEVKGFQYGSDSVNNELWIWQDQHKNTYHRGYLYECFPVLRPMKDMFEIFDRPVKSNEWLTKYAKEITENKKSLDYFRLWCSTKRNQATIKINIPIWEEDNEYRTLIVYKEVCGETKKPLYDFLIKNHFDVFGLIDAGLAVDINSLEPTSADSN